MNKRFAAVLAATAIAGVTTAFAANPFSDVTPQDWAYQAVSTLAAQGVINGYPDGTFKGQTNITRYEMAQMVAKAMARQDRVNAEQNAVINRLANEFAAELNNLGVRVDNLEKKVGNVKLTGDARLLYTEQESMNDDKYTFRVRLGAKAQVNENTVAGVRLVMGSEFADDNDKVTFDRAYVQHQFGENLTAVVGRQGLFVGQGLVLDDTVDAVTAVAKLGDKMALTAGYVQNVPTTSNTDEHSTLVQLGADLSDNLSAVGYWMNGESLDIYGGGLTATFDNVTVDGEYAKQDKQGKAWTAGLTFGNYNQAVKGTWSLAGRYLVNDHNGPIIAQTFNHKVVTVEGHGYKGWSVEANYALAKNLGLSAGYFFDQEATLKNDDGTYATRKDDYRVELNYKF